MLKATSYEEDFYTFFTNLEQYILTKQNSKMAV